MAYTDFINDDEEITLDTVTPYVAPEVEVSTSQYSGVTTPETTSYTAPESYTPSEEATVAGRMSGLLSSGSPYVEAARASGMQTAQDRGLLNSSMAATAGEKAAIESALPIAQQDAASFQEAGMAGYQGDITGQLAKQTYGNTANLTNVQAAASAQLSAQEATQQTYQTAYESAINSGLSAQEASQNAALAGYESALNAGLSEQEAQQKAWLEVMVQEGADYRQAQELSLKETIAMMELASQERTSLGSAMAEIGEQFMVQLANLQRDPNVTGTAKTAAIKTLQDAYRANLESVSSIYGINVDWAPLGTSPAGGVPQEAAPAPRSIYPEDWDISGRHAQIDIR